MERLLTDKVCEIDSLENEYEYEKATSLYLQLRKPAIADNGLHYVRKHLKFLIQKFEKEHWSDTDNVPESRIHESDLAFKTVEAENLFRYSRKKIIKMRLKEKGMKQKDLAMILNHGKSYMSELINGIRPFSKEDIVIIHKLFNIRYEDLIPPFIDADRLEEIKGLINKHKQLL